MSKFAFAGLAALLGAGPLCSLCGLGPQPMFAGGRPAAVAPSDTAKVELAIKGMTCGSCATTARIALERVPGVFQARVSYDSASAVVLYDPAKTATAELITKLREMTGYEARVVADAVSKKPAA